MAVPDPGWIAAQRLASARALRGACSATHLTRHREGFGWTVRPAPGSILASPRVASWNPEPDYFHHWTRDAAIALRAVPLAIAADPGARGFWLGFIADFVAFSLASSDPDRHGPAVNPLRGTTRPGLEQYLRPDAELAALAGDAWLGEPRLAPDGSPDPEQWSRPQHDGPALRASSLMTLLADLPEAASPSTQALIARDIAYTLRHAGQPCIGPWEEAPARRTTFTLLAQWDALDRAGHRDAAEGLAALIEQAACPATGGWRDSIEAPAGSLDSATCLALLHARRADGRFALTAPRSRATMAALKSLFAGLYPINASRNPPAIGRFASDIYCGGNPWYPTTLGFAEAHYRIATRTGDRDAFARAEGWMALIQSIAPDPGPLPEQFDRATGQPTSCLNLTWSAAAFLEATAARDAAFQAMGR